MKNASRTQAGFMEVEAGSLHLAAGRWMLEMRLFLILPIFLALPILVCKLRSWLAHLLALTALTELWFSPGLLHVLGEISQRTHLSALCMVPSTSDLPPMS